MNTRNTYTLITVLVILLLLCMKPRAETFSYGGAVRKVRGVVGDAGDKVANTVGYVGKGAVSGVVNLGVKPAFGMYRKGGSAYLSGVKKVSDVTVGGLKKVRGGIGSAATAIGISEDNSGRRVYSTIGKGMEAGYAIPGRMADYSDKKLRSAGSRLDKMVTGDKVADMVAKPYGQAYDLGKGVVGFYADGVEYVADGYDSVVGGAADKIIRGFNLD